MSLFPPTQACPLLGASNFRDIGGYSTEHGPVMTGRVFRSDQIAELQAPDLAYLQELGVSHALDFRGAHERKRSPYQYEFLRHDLLSIEPTIVQDLGSIMQAEHGQLTAAQARLVMQKTYVEFVQNHSAQFARVFDQLLNTEQAVLMHCTAGKDRTGFAVALVHSALGVAPDDIMHDYMLSQKYFKRPNLDDNRGLSDEVLDVVWGVEPAFLNAAFTQITQQYGSTQQYLQQALGLDTARQEQLLARYIS
ncbi:tyrosine-protein phosphatase [Alcaligenes endophyticus]|uniref:Tyrosine-protein phosphatase n=1 Tax=Alcaligenes endophyticus TaxID=1929088 RepID=A0ABT8EEL5_9BURK|nr:tyrosine-protein phosphatase [Alcaligenes endophyticus]MCX5592286.1 tyrosine-protein phosphatase [Alcaligenes endophyticus]MDN4119728.1 tyrosine-protein phosphatase [Alcaligenes endophyticus]